jgi:hypothetical protein
MNGRSFQIPLYQIYRFREILKICVESVITAYCGGTLLHIWRYSSNFNFVYSVQCEYSVPNLIRIRKMDTPPGSLCSSLANTRKKNVVLEKSSKI